MDDQLLTRLLVSAGLALVGLAFLGYAAWTRHGGSPAARRWMTDSPVGDTCDERMTVLGGPMIGVVCLCFAAIVLPVVGIYLAFLAVPVGVIAFILFVWVRMLFLPLPDAIYPRWARPIREQQRAADQALRASIRR